VAYEDVNITLVCSYCTDQY